MQKPPRKIMLVDDHPVARKGLASVIGAQKGWSVAAEAGDCEEALVFLGNAEPDLVIADLSMPGRGGLEFIKDALRLRPGLRILVVSMHEEQFQAEKSLRTGALGYVMKDAGPERILEAIRRVLNGEIYLSPLMSARILDLCSGRNWQSSKSPVENLTGRQFQIFQLLGRGFDSKRIARRLRLSFKTVDAHRDQMKRRLKLPDGASLLRHAAHWVKTQGEAENIGGRKKLREAGLPETPAIFPFPGPAAAPQRLRL